jgi:hypothetical protein
MHKMSKAPLLIVCASLLTAADPSWTAKPPKDWNDADVRQILTDSPWVGRAALAELPRRNESEVRTSGGMGSGQSVGIEALSASALTGVGARPSRRRARSSAPVVEVRWESALPVRDAELKALEDDPPAWQGTLYAIAVYDVPGLSVSRKALRKEAYLKRDGKKELKPLRVDVLPQEGGLNTIVYLFPRSEEITARDARVEFAAVFGRLSLARYFYPPRMQYQGKLEL